jgi:hypothetical protein
MLLRELRQIRLKKERDVFAKIAATSPGLIYSMRQNKDGSLSYPYASDDESGVRSCEIENDIRFCTNPS